MLLFQECYKWKCTVGKLSRLAFQDPCSVRVGPASFHCWIPRRAQYSLHVYPMKQWLLVSYKFAGFRLATTLKVSAARYVFTVEWVKSVEGRGPALAGHPTYTVALTEREFCGWCGKRMPASGFPASNQVSKSARPSVGWMGITVLRWAPEYALTLPRMHYGLVEHQEWNGMTRYEGFAFY